MTIQLPKNTPIGPIKLFPVWIVQMKPEKQTHSKNTAKNFLIVFIMLALFQDKFDRRDFLQERREQIFSHFLYFKLGVGVLDAEHEFKLH